LSKNFFGPNGDSSNGHLVIFVSLDEAGVEVAVAVVGEVDGAWDPFYLLAYLLFFCHFSETV
jgi:hypothetical protein